MIDQVDEEEEDDTLHQEAFGIIGMKLNATPVCYPRMISRTLTSNVLSKIIICFDELSAYLDSNFISCDPIMSLSFACVCA